MKVGRIAELVKAEEVIKQVDTRAIALSPLEYDVKLDDVESFFGQFAKVNSVRLSHHVVDKKLFCGTALLEFSSQEDAESILNESLVYSGAELELKPKKVFHDERKKMLEEHKTTSTHVSNLKHNSNGEPEYPKGLIVSFKLKMIKDEGSAAQNGVNEHPAEGNAPSDEADVPKSDGVEASNYTLGNVREEGSRSIENGDQDKDMTVDEDIGAAAAEKETEDEDQSSENEEDNEEKHSLAASKDSMDVVRREDLKTVFNKFGTVKILDTFGLKSLRKAQKARAAAILAEEGGLLVKNLIAVLEPVTGDAEKEYWKALRGNQGRFRITGAGVEGEGDIPEGSILAQRIKTLAAIQTRLKSLSFMIPGSFL